MRTTLNLDSDVAQMLKRRMAGKKLSLKQAVNQALRTGLAATAPHRRLKFKVEPHPFRFKPGIDLDKLNQR